LGSYVEPPTHVVNGWATLLIFLPPLSSSSPCSSPADAEAACTASTTGTLQRPEKFIGLKNYGYLSATRPSRSLINNGLIIVVSLLVQLPWRSRGHDGGRRIAGAAVFRMIFFLPMSWRTSRRAHCDSCSTAATVSERDHQRA